MRCKRAIRFFFITIYLVVHSGAYGKGVLQNNFEISADSLFSIGDSHYYRSEYQAAIEYYKSASNEFKTSFDSTGMSRALNDIGLCYKRLGEFDSAFNFYQRAISIDKLTGDSLSMIGKYRNLSNLYVAQGSYVKASKILLEAREIAERHNYKKALGRLNNSLGGLYENQENYEKSLFYHRLAKEEYAYLGDTLRYGIALNNMGNNFSNLKRWDSAFFYFRSALEIKKKTAGPGSIAYTLHNLGSLHYRVESYDSAEYYLGRAYAIRVKESDDRGIASSANELAQVYLKKQMPKKALPFLDQARKYAMEKNNLRIIIENLNALSDYHLQTGDTTSAYALLNSWVSLRDSTFSKEKFTVQELQSAYELNQKEIERQLEEEKTKNQSRIARNRLVIIVIVLAATLTLIVLVLFILRQRRKINELNERLKVDNRDMFHRKKNDYMRILDEISASNMPISNVMKGRLLASAAVDESLYEEEADTVELSDYLTERLEDIGESQGADAKSITLQIIIPKMYIGGQKASAMLLILNELITNSFKHSFPKQGGCIHIMITEEKGIARVIYQDDGLPFIQKFAKDGMGQQIMLQVLKSMKSKLSREVQGKWNRSLFEVKIR